jgi:3-oxocholest-4-en-26-oyl-CoA dehydrogenase beta subunit
MDFAFDAEQEAVRESAQSVVRGIASPERVAQIEKSETRFDEELWTLLARANLLGLAVPEDFGGSGLGLTELCIVLEELGRSVVPVPFWATTVLGCMPIAGFGTREQKQRWLPGVVSGDVVLSAALTEVGESGSGGRAATDGAALRCGARAERSEGGWRLTGVATAVPQAHLAERVVVPAMAGEALVVVLVDPRGTGVRMELATTTDRQLHPHLRFEGAPITDGDVLAGPDEGTPVVEWMLQRARTGLCATALGVCEEAVRRSAEFLNERHQFGRPLSSFQATLLRAADAYIDTEAMRVTLWQAAWRLDTGRPAEQAVATAKWWASDAGQRVVHASQHLHGGIGADVEYPIHRYFLWGKQIELMLGGPSAELASLGALVAGEFRSTRPHVRAATSPEGVGR